MVVLMKTHYGLMNKDVDGQLPFHILTILHFFLGLLVLPSVTLKVHLCPSLAFSYFSVIQFDIVLLLFFQLNRPAFLHR